MFYADVFRNAVAAPGAATERKRGGEFEVIQIAYAALRRGSVYENTAGLHTRREFVEFSPFGYRVEVNRRGMTVAAVRNKSFGFREGVLNVFRLIHGENGGKFFVGEFFRKFHAFDFAYKNLRSFGNFYVGEFGDFYRFLTNDFGVKSAVYNNRFTNFFRFFGVEEIASSFRKFGFNRVVDILVNDYRLFGRADHTVIERLGVNYRVDRKYDVGGVVDDGGGVAGSYAERGFTGRISGFDHSRTAGCKDNIRLFHQKVSHFERGNVNPFYNALGSARLNGGVENDFRGGDSRFFGSRVGTDDNRVSRFQGDHRLEDGCRSRVGRGDNRRDNAERLRDFLYAVSLVFFDDAAGLRVLVRVVNIFRRVVVFDYLVFDDAHSGFLNRHFGKGNTSLVRSDGGSLKNLVHLFLRVGREYALSRFDSCDRRFQRFYAVDYLSFIVYHSNLLYVVKILT